MTDDPTQSVEFIALACELDADEACWDVRLKKVVAVKPETEAEKP